MSKVHGLFRSSRHAGFTLVEMLVVIAIIALLMAVLLPSLKSARDSAKSIACQSQLRQQGVAVSMYREDWKQYFPIMYQTYTDSGGSFIRAFPFRLRPYLGGLSVASNGRVYAGFDTGRSGRHVFYCPAAPFLTRTDYTGAGSPFTFEAWIDGPSWDWTIATYNSLSGLGYHTYHGDPSNVNYSVWLKQKHWLRFPSRTLVYIDGRREPRVDHSFQFVNFRHHDGANTLMGDLAVKHRTGNELDALFLDRVFHLYDPTSFRYAR